MKCIFLTIISYFIKILYSIPNSLGTEFSVVTHFSCVKSNQPFKRLKITRLLGDISTFSKAKYIIKRENVIN